MMDAPLFIGIPGDDGRTTANRFAQDCFASPRLVGRWHATEPKFKLVDGNRWYRIESYRGVWAIFPERSAD